MFSNLVLAELKLPESIQKNKERNYLKLTIMHPKKNIEEVLK